MIFPCWGPRGQQEPRPGSEQAGWWAGSPAGPCWRVEKPQVPWGQSHVTQQSRRRLVPRTVQVRPGWGGGKVGLEGL